MKYMEYKEVKIPQEMLDTIQGALAKMQESGEGEPPTMGDVGVMKWLTRLSKDEGWRVVWQAFNYPFFVLEREVVEE